MPNPIQDLGPTGSTFARPMIIDFVARSDYLEKPGGDTSQLENYKYWLERFDPTSEPVIVANLGKQTDLRPHSTVIAINIDRFYEMNNLVQMAKESGHKVILCTVHHSRPAVKRMRRADPTLSMRKLVDLLPESTREYVAYSRRMIQSQKRTSLLSLVPFACARLAEAPKLIPKAQRKTLWTLNNANAICTLSDIETTHLQRDFGNFDAPVVKIPNGRAESFQASNSPAWSSRSQTLLCVGRIEPRKRQLELARECERQRVEINFIGGLNPNSGRYTHRFNQEVSRGKYTHYLGQLTHSETLEHMLNSRVLVNASWVEVQSLVDIEAATCGMYVCTSDDGSSQEWLGESVEVVRGHNISEMVLHSIALSRNTFGPPTAVYDKTWEQSSRTLWELCRTN